MSAKKKNGRRRKSFFYFVIYFGIHIQVLSCTDSFICLMWWSLPSLFQRSVQGSSASMVPSARMACVSVQLHAQPCEKQCVAAMGGHTSTSVRWESRLALRKWTLRWLRMETVKETSSVCPQGLEVSACCLQSCDTVHCGFFFVCLFFGFLPLLFSSASYNSILDNWADTENSSEWHFHSFAETQRFT